ncbi:lipocalin family protein [Thiohalorhabdus sp.]|uniref:lipocalin family protein n=1 Tax=Thiohalorhabdus sp. TaxID=3094134 RepID=UPI002FC3D7FC
MPVRLSSLSRIRPLLTLIGAALALAACSAQKPPIKTAASVDLERFMGDWYVIAHVPAPLEANAHNAVESYRLTEDGQVATTFRFREGSFDGEVYTYHPMGFVRPESGNAVWDMQFFWPIRFEYRIVYLDDTYTRTIIGRRARDYAWVMARSPSLSEASYDNLVGILRDRGYDTDDLRRVPQQWPEGEQTSKESGGD